MAEPLTAGERRPRAADSDARCLPRLLTGDFAAGPARLADHLARYGPLPPSARRRSHREDLIAEVELAGLTGRGGAGFPTAKKLAAVAARRHAVVVANGTEGEPASAKDKVLMATSPHLVLDGAAVAADLVGASQAIVVVHRAVTEIVAAAAAERRRQRLDHARISVVRAADGFVAGEASAVVRWLDHGVAKPKPAPPRPSERGLHGRPTLVQNVETLAHLALIARYGAAWFRAVGTSAEPGSMLVTLAGAVERPGVHEVAVGTRIRDVLALGGDLEEPAGALLIGGYFGTWVEFTRAADLPLSEAGLAGVGASVGAGLIGVLPARACGLAETAWLARYLADESAGQCGPCVFGLDAIARQMERLASGQGAEVAKLDRWIGQIGTGRGACKHPDGTVAMVASALRAFEGEVRQHLRGRCTGTNARQGVLPVPPRSRR